jgi:hypothetical protein
VVACAVSRLATSLPCVLPRISLLLVAGVYCISDHFAHETTRGLQLYDNISRPPPPPHLLSPPPLPPQHPTFRNDVRARYSAMHKTVGGRLHFASASCPRHSFPELFSTQTTSRHPNSSLLLLPCAPPANCRRPRPHLRLQHSPSLQIERDAACASAWAALQHVVLLHSSDDATVPAASSVRMHRALASRGIRSRLLIATGSHCSSIMGNGFVHPHRGLCLSCALKPASSLFSASVQRSVLLALVAQAASTTDPPHERQGLDAASQLNVNRL